MKRLVLSVSIAALLAVLPGSAQGAPAPKQLGEVASAVTAFGNCPCTSVQFGDIGTANNSYSFPFGGVITKSGFYIGDEINAADWVQMRSFAHSGTNRVTVAGDGAKHMLQGLPPKSIARFYERLPVSALGVLGARYSIASAFIEATPTYFNSPNTVDEVLGTTTSLSMGASFEGTPTKKLRVNVEAVLEPDEDHDAYGDVSQDLCPESPIGGGPCSGTLFGSDLQEAHGTGGGAAFGSKRQAKDKSKLQAKPPKIVSVKRDKKGRYEVKVKVQQPGTITAQLTGKLKPKGKASKLGKAAKKIAGKAGTYTLTLKPPKGAREAKIRAKLVVTLAASGFLPAQASKSFKLR